MITDGMTLNNSMVSITPATSVDGSQESVITGLLEGTYWISIQDNVTGNLNCITSAEYTLTSNFIDVDLNLANLTVGDATDCTTPDDGSIEIEFADFVTAGVATDMDGLQIDIDGQTTTLDDATYNPGAGTFTITDLAPDIYNITITDEAKGCVSPVYQVEISNVPTLPTLTAGAIEADNFCDDTNNSNGFVRIAMTNPSADESDYVFSWYEGVGTGGTQPVSYTHLTLPTIYSV